MKQTIEIDVPEDYEISCQTNSSNGIYIDFKKKEVKNWEWYLEKYLHSLAGFLDTHQRTDVRNGFKESDYNNIRLEFKIGLLKFICDDFNESLFHFIFDLNNQYKKVKNINYVKIFNICPIEFIDSLFK